MPTITFQPNTGSDTHLNADSPTTNYATDVDIVIGENKTGSSEIERELIKFALDDGTLPSNAVIVSAVLTLTYKATGTTYASNNRTCRVYRVKRAWVENQATWNIYSSGNSWGTAGCGDTTNDREATDIGSATFLTAAAVDDTIAITLTPTAIQQMITGGSFTNNGFLLKMDTETDDLYDFHSGNGVTSSKRPKLVVTYYISGAALFFAMI